MSGIIIPDNQSDYPSPPKPKNNHQRRETTYGDYLLIAFLIIFTICLAIIVKPDDEADVTSDLSVNKQSIDSSETSTVPSVVSSTGGETSNNRDDSSISENIVDSTTDVGEYLIVEPGSTYVVRFGGYIYSTTEENDTYIMYYTSPGEILEIDERLENYWYKVTFYLTGEGIAHQGYIKIQ